MAKCTRRNLRMNSKSIYSKPVIILADVICPICMGILIEPVTTPCQHELCLDCLNRNFELVQFACPICRKRISSWARKAVRSKTLINIAKWKQIQEKFPDDIKRKLEGNEDGNLVQEALDVPACHILLSQPGEIKKEYEELLKKFQEEWERERERETLASLQLITDLQRQEEKQMVEERQRRRHTAIQDDILAKETSGSSCSSRSACSSQPSSRSDSSRVAASSSSNMKGVLTDKESAQLRSTSAESNDSITSEMCHFKPISAAPRTPPKRLPNGRFEETEVVYTKARRLVYSSDLLCSKVLSVKIQAIMEDSQNKSTLEGGTVPLHSSGTLFINKKFNCARKPNIDLSFKENYPFYSGSESQSQSPTKSVLTGVGQNGSMSTRTTRSSKGSKQSYKTCEPSGDENNAYRKRKTEEKAVMLRKTARLEDDETEASTSDSQAPSTNCNVEEEVSWDNLEQQTLERLRQEETDWQLAMQLQEEFNRSLQRSQMVPGNQYFLRSQKKK